MLDCCISVVNALEILRSCTKSLMCSYKGINCFVVSLTHFPQRRMDMRQWTGSALVQIMACRLFGAKPLSELIPVYCPLGTKFNEIRIKIQKSSFMQNTFTNVVYKMEAILSRGRWVIFYDHFYCSSPASGPVTAASLGRSNVPAKTLPPWTRVCQNTASGVSKILWFILLRCIRTVVCVCFEECCIYLHNRPWASIH